MVTDAILPDVKAEVSKQLDEEGIGQKAADK